MGQLFVSNDDFRHLLTHALAGTQIKGHAGPAPVVDEGFDCNEGFCIRIWIVRIFEVQIAGHLLCSVPTLRILAPHHMIGDGRFINNPQGSTTFTFSSRMFRSHGIWRFHGHQTEQLHQMILQHILQLTDLIVIRKTTVDSYGFRHSDLYMIDGELSHWALMNR